MTLGTNDQVVKFTLEEIRSTRVCRSRILIGRLFAEDGMSAAELRDALNRPWQGVGRIIVKQIAYGLFEFVLPTEADKTWVLQRTPWVINDRILNVRAWTQQVSHHTFEELAVAPFRVQMWDVQDDCCTQHFGRKIASATLGRVLEAGVFSCTDTNQKFIKVKTLLDFSKPLRSQIMASNEETGGFWIRFKYEHLPSFCYNCGRVGHYRQGCTFDPPSRQEKYGPHMSTKKMGRKIFEGDADDHQFRRHSHSVWINNNAREGRMANVQPLLDSGKDDKREPTVAVQSEGGTSPLWMGTSTRPFMATEPGKPNGRSPIRFPMTKAPKMNIGRRGRHGKTKKEEDGSPMEVEELPQKASRLKKPPRQNNGAGASMAEGKIYPVRRNRRNRGGSPVPSPVGECGATELKLAHRRRLILEDESEDEFVVKAIPAPKLVERKRTGEIPGPGEGMARRGSEAKPKQQLKPFVKKGRRGGGGEIGKSTYLCGRRAKPSRGE
ncbi:unnamed protein product [Linum trigynum]|uniref:CCHC-type domain-containing protein n=1 Tax=Linum trigynum TaxID=586398 RepID=A0AAV2DXA8_9ROSI